MEELHIDEKVQNTDEKILNVGENLLRIDGKVLNTIKYEKDWTFIKKK